MSEFQKSIRVDVPANDVFAYLSRVENMPDYLPTVTSAIGQSEGRVRVQGVANGHSYDNDGYYQVDSEKKRMEWGSDGENDYRGWLQVTESRRPDDTQSSAEVTVHLSFEPNPVTARKLEEQTGDRDKTIEQGLEKSLQSIKAVCEGQDAAFKDKVIYG